MQVVLENPSSSPPSPSASPSYRKIHVGTTSAFIKEMGDRHLDSGIFDKALEVYSLGVAMYPSDVPCQQGLLRTKVYLLLLLLLLILLLLLLLLSILFLLLLLLLLLLLIL